MYNEIHKKGQLKHTNIDGKLCLFSNLSNSSDNRYDLFIVDLICLHSSQHFY